MNTFIAIVFSALTAMNVIPEAKITTPNVQSANGDITSYLASMASGKQGDPLACVFLTSDNEHWKQAVKLIELGYLVDTTKTDSTNSKYKAYRLTMRGVKHFN